MSVKPGSTKYNVYADDIEFYMTLKPCDEWDDISSSIQACITYMCVWINNNVMKQNKNMTECIGFTSKHHLWKTENLRIRVESSSVKKQGCIGKDSRNGKDG